MIYKKYFKKEILSKKILVNKNSLPKNWKIKLSGDHNKENIILVIEVAKNIGISNNKIKKSIESFIPVEGRL